MIIKNSCVNVWIDKIVPCLRDTQSGELKDTVVFKIESRSYLKKFRESNGWYINWDETPKDVEVYALALHDTNEIQGLVGVKNDVTSQAAFVHWACTAPWNNKHEHGTQRYEGVGGHLFAIAADKSIDWGYHGVMHAYAASLNLLKHYESVFNAIHLGMLHDYQFLIDEIDAQNLLEVYNFEWN